MDITQLFKACCKTVRLRSKLDKQPPVVVTKIGDKNKKLANQSDSSNSQRPPNKLREKFKSDPFTKKSKDLQFQITQIKNFLIENRAAYMKFACHLKSAAQMTDDERDLIDRETEKILLLCTEMLSDLRARNLKFSHQIDEHVECILELLLTYLGKVSKVYTEQKEYRIQRDLETYSFMKLQSDKKKLEISSNRISNGGTNNRGINGDNNDDDSDQVVDDDDDDMNTLNGTDDNLGKSLLNGEGEGLRNRKRGAGLLKNKYKLSLDDEISNSNLIYNGDDDDEISPEDVQMFESENVQLFNELKGVSEEVEQIEKNVVDIAKLQDIFTEKVTLQKHDIDRIANTVVGATEDIRDANEQIKQAIQRNAGLRVYILFFLIVMSFSLLFLDWYND